MQEWLTLEFGYAMYRIAKKLDREKKAAYKEYERRCEECPKEK